MLILVPLLSLAALWGFATTVAYGDAEQLLESRQFQQKSVLPTQRLIAELQKERRLSLWRLGGAQSSSRGELDTQRRSTDEARAVVERNARADDLRDGLMPRVRAGIDTLVARLNTLETVRRAVDDHTAERRRVLAEFSGIVDAGFGIWFAVAPNDGRIAMDARTLTTLGRAREFLSRQDALLSGALAAGRITAEERGQFAQLSGAQRFLYSDTAPNLPPAELARYEALVGTPQFEQLRRLEDQVVRGAEPNERSTRTGQQSRTGQAARTGRAAEPPVDAAHWRGTVDTVNHRLYAFENTVLDGVTDRAEGIALTVFGRLALAGGLGLIAFVASAVIAVRISRRLLRECRTLAARVTDFARQRLPVLADQVRSGAPVDPAEEPAEFGYRIDEIRQISESFTATRDAVLVAAAGEVAARRGISEVFVNLARRNQALLHRQLSLLDTMERRTEDPAELSDLFRLDHLATRMRRHAEGLVILAGKNAGRGWRRPVPLVDVVRGAVAEVEDYPRVRVQPLPRLAVLGTAVADLIHLLAEMVENATTFSPPQAPVLVSGHQVGNGFVIEIEDRGLGMTEEAVRTANARLADPPDFDPADSAQLGLFVVARLARRHDIKVTLRQSPYGGTTAIALIPGALIVESPEPEPALRRGTGPMHALPVGGGVQTQTQPGVVRLVAEAERGPAGARLAEPAPAAQPPAPEPEEPSGPEPSTVQPELTADGLPKRRRQEHMAPQLRAKVDARRAAQDAPQNVPMAAPVPDPAPPEGDPDPERSPETMRSMMSAMQRGWQRGRDQAHQAPPAPVDQQAGPTQAEEDDTP